MKTRGRGLASPSSSFLARSIVISRNGWATWIAARPIPGALYMVSNMSSASLRISGVTFSIGFDTSRNCLSGRMMISRSAMISLDPDPIGSDQDLFYLVEHDLFGKPVPTFPDQARYNSAGDLSG